MSCSARAGPPKATPPPTSTPSHGASAWLLSETGIPRRIKAAYLDDDTIKYLAAYAARLRARDRRMSPVHALNGHATTTTPGRS